MPAPKPSRPVSARLAQGRRRGPFRLILWSLLLNSSAMMSCEPARLAVIGADDSTHAGGATNGGAASSGDASGGAATGGTATGGDANGGTATGGDANGGAAAGGTATGGD